MDELLNFTQQLLQRALSPSEVLWLEALYRHLHMNIEIENCHCSSVSECCKNLVSFLLRACSEEHSIQYSESLQLPIESKLVSVQFLQQQRSPCRSQVKYATTRKKQGSSIFSQEHNIKDENSTSERKEYPEIPNRDYVLVGVLCVGEVDGVECLVFRDGTGTLPVEVLPRLFTSALSLITSQSSGPSLLSAWQYIPPAIASSDSLGYLELFQQPMALLPRHLPQNPSLHTIWQIYSPKSVECFLEETTQLPPSPPQSYVGVVHIYGQLTALSPVIGQTVPADLDTQNSKYRESTSVCWYFARLSSIHSSVNSDDDDSQSSVVLLFRGSGVLALRRILRLYSIYLFLNLKPTTLHYTCSSESLERQSHLVLLCADPCCVYPVENSPLSRQLWPLCSATSTPPPSFSVSPCCASPSSRVVNYNGTLSRCVSDAVLELDGICQLYLTHYPLLDTLGGRGLRVGARLQLYNVHPIFRRHRLIGFGCCIFSHIEVEEFSPYQTYSKPLSPNAQLFRVFWHSLTFADLVWFNEVYDMFVKKFGGTMSMRQLLRFPGVLHRFVELYVPERVTINIYAQFLAHNIYCPLGRVTSANDRLPTPVTLQEFLSLPPLVCARRTLQSHSTSTYQVIPHDALATYSLVGYLRLSDYSSDLLNHFVLTDNTASVPTFSTEVQPEHVNGLWLIRRYNVVMESVEENDTACAPLTYVHISLADALRLDDSSPPTLSLWHSHSFTSTQFVLIRRLSMLTAQAQFEVDGFLLALPVESTTNSVPLRLVVGSPYQSWYSLLHPGFVYALTSLIFPTASSSPATVSFITATLGHHVLFHFHCLARVQRVSFVSEETRQVWPTSPPQTDNGTPSAYIIIPETIHRQFQSLSPLSAFLPLLEVKELLSIDVANEHTLLCNGDTVNFVGVITWKGILDEENAAAYRGHNNRSRSVKRGKVLLRVRQVSGPNHIVVYLPLRTIKYPLALLPGCAVFFLSFRRRLSKSRNYYCTATPHSSLYFAHIPTLEASSDYLISMLRSLPTTSDLTSSIRSFELEDDISDLTKLLILTILSSHYFCSCSYISPLVLNVGTPPLIPGSFVHFNCILELNGVWFVLQDAWREF
jgi:hypothetical protein